MPPSDRPIAFLGCGNIVSAILDGVCAAGYPSQGIVVSARDRQSLREKARIWGATAAATNAQAVQKAAIVVLAVKPMQAVRVLTEIAPHLKSDHHLLISLVAGLKLDTLAKLQPCPAIRVMPNLASRVRHGLSAILAAPGVDLAQLQWTRDFFALVGHLAQARDDDQMDVYTALCGSGPAYFYYFLEALVKSGISLGLSAEDAQSTAVRTGLGALQLVAAGSRDLAAYVKEIAVAKGTTRAALDILQSSDVQEKLSSACAAAAQRASGIGDALDKERQTL